MKGASVYVGRQTGDSPMMIGCLPSGARRQLVLITAVITGQQDRRGAGRTEAAWGRTGGCTANTRGDMGRVTTS